VRTPAILAAFGVLGILAPAAAVFWFMNEAAAAQADAARHNVMEAYRVQLRLLRDRLDADWKVRASVLDRGAGARQHVDAVRLRKAVNADAIVLFDGSGQPVYPAQPRKPSSSVWPDEAVLDREPPLPGEAVVYWEQVAGSQKDPGRAAVAAQNQIRCLMRLGDKQRTLAAIRKWFTAGPAARALDAGGRSPAASAQLLGLRLVNRQDPSFAPAVQRLLEAVNDFGAPLPAAQRLFLESELRALAPDLPRSPEVEALRLAVQYQEAAMPRGGRGLQAASLPEVWKLESSDRSVVALYRTAAATSLSGLSVGGHGDAPVAVHPPGMPATGEVISAGATLPGWQISITAADQRPFDEAARRRKGAYIAIGSAVIIAIAITGSLAGHSFRRQARLARLKTDLVAAVSHELRTPLASMSLLLENLLEDRQFDETKTREYLQLMAGENERLRRLIQNFLAFSRIERNRQTFEFEAVEPADVAEAAIQSMRDRLEGVVTVDVPRSLPPVRADRDALTTVLLNLLDNAWKYTGAEKRIELRAAAGQSDVVFSVSDNGAGIPAREQRKIFRRFYQVDRRLARETGGCGLGLSIVDHLVRAHAGEVAVKSEPGAGSTFTIRIPQWSDA
jgi:signal transduction histidine kinase/type II secretory pathway pseudopilin PulG